MWKVKLKRLSTCSLFHCWDECDWRTGSGFLLRTKSDRLSLLSSSFVFRSRKTFQSALCRLWSISARATLFPSLCLKTSFPDYFWEWDREQMARSSAGGSCTADGFSGVPSPEWSWCEPKIARRKEQIHGTHSPEWEVRGKKPRDVCPDTTLRCLHRHRRAADGMWYGSLLHLTQKQNDAVSLLIL